MIGYFGSIGRFDLSIVYDGNGGNIRGGIATLIHWKIGGWWW